jgi:hypothetical protein
MVLRDPDVRPYPDASLVWIWSQLFHSYKQTTAPEERIQPIDYRTSLKIPSDPS